MLPTYEKSNIILSGFKTLFLSPPMEVKSSDTFQNLYILSDDKPLKNDWVLCLGEIEGNKHHKVTLGDRQYISPIRQRGEKDTCLNCKKIIATTADIMLKCNDGSGFYTAPDLPTSFIQHYIEQYNIGNVITEVEVEYPIGTVILDSEYKDKVTVLSNDFTYDENIGSLHVYTTQGIKGRLTFNDVYRPKEGWSEIVTESLVGRYLKYIGTSSDKPAYGDYFRIDSMESMGLFRLKDKSSGCKWTPEEVLKGTSKDFELMPEGFNPEDNKNKFEIGKWYKTKAGSFVKYKNSDRGVFNASEYFIYDHLKKLCKNANFGSINNKFEEVSLDEMQKYLPESHPDKIKTISEFKKGDYIVTLKGEFKGTSCGKENYCFKARETLYYLRPVIDLAGSDSNGNDTIKFDKSHKGCTDWRYATPEEIAEYNRLGKPFDVTTLSKKESVNTTILRDQVKAGLRLKGRWLKCIKNNIWKDDIKIGEYFQIDENDSTVPYVLYKNQIEPLDLERVDLLGEFELMPEGWTPETKETIVSKVPEYVECIKSNNKNFTVGEIYTWPRPIDNDGAKRNPGVLNGSVWTFKPSTKKEYDWQKQKGKLLLMDSIPHPDFNNFGTRKSASISDLSYNPCGEIPVIKHYSVGIDPAIMQKPLTVKESYPTKETIKTQVISTNIINIPLKSKKKKQLFTI